MAKSPEGREDGARPTERCQGATPLRPWLARGNDPSADENLSVKVRLGLGLRLEQVRFRVRVGLELRLGLVSRGLACTWVLKNG